MTATKVSNIDYGKALTWYVNDKKLWPTIVTLSLYVLSCIFVLPVFYVGPFMTGYLLKMIKNIQEKKFELPDLEGPYWREGVTLILVTTGVSAIVAFFFMIFIFGGTIVSEVLSESVPIASIVIMVATQVVNIVLQLIGSLLLPLISFVFFAIYTKTGSLNSLVTVENYKRIWEQNTWGIVISYAIYFAAVSALSTLGFMACCIGILPAMVVSNFVMAGFIGQLEVEGVS